MQMIFLFVYFLSVMKTIINWVVACFSEGMDEHTAKALQATEV